MDPGSIRSAAPTLPQCPVEPMSFNASWMTELRAFVRLNSP